jgi:sterol desaturase/sphingolipid hydroxylase (fatty acid hydroxylase superfamily)
MSATQLSLVVMTLSALAMLLAERRWPYNAGQQLFREGFWTDFVGYCLLQSYALGLLITGILTWARDSRGWAIQGALSHWPVWAQVLLFLVTHDLYIYCFHRFQHGNKWFWRLHEAHHSTPHVDWLSGVRSHSLEILINQTIEFAPMLLLGASPEVPVIKGTISAVWGMFIHANIDVKLGPLQYVFNGPEMHRWHHALDREAYDMNFGTKFALWDWLFGTAYFPDRKTRKAEAYGLEDPNFPLGNGAAYFKQHAYAFRAHAETQQALHDAKVAAGEAPAAAHEPHDAHDAVSARA